MKPRPCQHGHLRRKCEPCELAQELTELKAALKRLLEAGDGMRCSLVTIRRQVLKAWDSAAASARGLVDRT